jgi:hypothetical protein
MYPISDEYVLSDTIYHIGELSQSTGSVFVMYPDKYPDKSFIPGTRHAVTNATAAFMSWDLYWRTHIILCVFVKPRLSGRVFTRLVAE